MVKVEWSKKSIKQIMSIDKRYKTPINDKINDLVNFPSVTSDIKKMKGSDNRYRMRVGDYRIIFEIISGQPVICAIKEIKRRTSTTY